MSEVANYKTQKLIQRKRWYNNYEFPLIPIIKYKKADQHNTASFSFRWLFIKLWTLDSFSIELSVVMCTHWGIGIIGILPYLRFGFTIPFTEKMSIFLSKHLDRRPPPLLSKEEHRENILKKLKI